jgi:hypothetical protein
MVFPDRAHLYKLRLLCGLPSGRPKKDVSLAIRHIRVKGATILAIFHFTAKIVSRSRGQSAVAKAAYNGHDLLTNEKTGERHDYRRKGEVKFSGIFAPNGAPDWAHDRQALWSEVEKTEKRVNSQLAREVEIALPHELTDKQREYLMKDFVRENFVRHGMVADVAIHAPSKDGDGRNHHAHILLTMREIGQEGFGAKMREFNSKAQLEQWRENWEHLANRQLERFGHEARIDRRSLEAQGIDREPTIHEGPAATQFKREGVLTERGDINRNIETRNRQREELKKERKDNERLQKALLRPVSKNTAPQNHQAMHTPDDSAAAFLKHQSKKREEDNTAKLIRAQQAPEKAAQKRNNQKFQKSAERGVEKTAHVAGRLTGGFLKAVDSVLDFFVGSPPPHKHTPAELARDPAARRENYAQQAAARQRNEALDRWGEQLKGSGNDYSRLSADDVRYLSGADLENIRAHNEDAVAQIVREREKEREMETGRGRNRER